MDWFVGKDKGRVGPLSEAGAAQSLPVHYAAPRSGWTNKDTAATAAVGDIAGPWARFWARNFDILVSGLLVGAVAGMIAPALFLPGSPIESGTGQMVFALIMFPLALVVDAAIYALFGNTLGKLIAGVKVLTCDGLNLTFSAYLRRNLTMYVRGYAFGIPIVYLGTLIYSWRKASRGELLGWDVATKSACVGKGDGVFRNVITAGSMIAIAFLCLLAG